MKMRFSSESSYTELTADKGYTSKMLAQNIVNNRMSASKVWKTLQFWGKIEPREDLVAEIIWNLGSKRAHMTTYTAPVP